MVTKTVYVAYCVKKIAERNESSDEWSVVVASPPEPGKINWVVSEVWVGQKFYFPTLESVKEKVKDILGPLLNRGYSVLEESEQVVRQLSVLPCPLVIKDREEWLCFLRHRYPKVAVVSPLINAGKRRHLAHTRNRPPLVVVMTEDGATHRWAHNAHTFWGDVNSSERVLKQKRNGIIADLKARGYFVVQTSLAQAHAISGLWGNSHASPWEYPFISWDEYSITLPVESQYKCRHQFGKDGIPLFAA